MKNKIVKTDLGKALDVFGNLMTEHPDFETWESKLSQFEIMKSALERIDTLTALSKGGLGIINDIATTALKSDNV